VRVPKGTTGAVTSSQGDLEECQEKLGEVGLRGILASALEGEREREKEKEKERERERERERE